MGSSSSAQAEVRLDAAPLQKILQNCIQGDSYKAACLGEQKNLLEDFLTQTSLFSRDQYQILSREGKIAFWVNAYTGWLLRILSDLPSGRATLPRFSPPFSNYKLVVMEESYSLLEMQREMWEEFKDERIFFVLSDGTAFGPSFLKTPLEAPRVEEVLKESTLQYLRNPDYVNLRKKELLLSAFLRDVKPFLFFNYGGSEIEHKRAISDEDLALVNFLYQNAENEETRSALKQLNFKIQYLPADTRLKRT